MSILTTRKVIDMELIGQKIRRLIKKNYKTIKMFYAELMGMFGESSIDRSTLTRLLKNQVVVRERTLNQIAIVLGVKTSFLREGTDVEVTDVAETEALFTYNDTATLKILEKNLPFATTQLSLKRNGRTSEEQDSTDCKDSLKWIFVVVGKIELTIKTPQGKETRTLHKSQRTWFDARNLHTIRNLSKSTSVCLIIHYPAKNNVFCQTSQAKA